MLHFSEVFRVYNNWLAQYCSYAPTRLIGLGLLSVWDVALAVREPSVVRPWVSKAP